jgi:glycosyltransferase involved in cell wall biosynthesis
MDILGHGVMTARWKKIAKRLNIESRCIWHGWVDKNRAIDIVSKADLFIFTSLHESTPAVIFEALSQGVPVICIDRCGQGDVVTDECGMKIPVTSSKQVIDGFAQAIQILAPNVEKRRRLAEGARRRVLQFSWELKAKLMIEVYESALRRWQERNARASLALNTD